MNFLNDGFLTTTFSGGTFINALFISKCLILEQTAKVIYIARKPAKMYRYVRSQATTRREYMGGVPPSRITQFVIGNRTMSFPVSLEMTANEKCQLRHTSLEAARISANKALEKTLAPRIIGLLFACFLISSFGRTNKRPGQARTVSHRGCGVHTANPWEPQPG